jgi:hypothetical protein
MLRGCCFAKKKNKKKPDTFDPVAGINFDSDAFPIKLDNFG